LQKARKHTPKSAAFKNLNRIKFAWIEPRTYKKNLLTKKGLPFFSAQLVADQINADLAAAVAAFYQTNPLETDRLILLAPESSFPFQINELPDIVDLWANTLDENCFFAFGTYRSNGNRTFRTTCIMNQDGILQFVDKQKMMPFAERNLAPAEQQMPAKARLASDLTLVPLVCFEFFIDISSVKRANDQNDLPIIFANDFWFAPYFKALLRNQARLAEAWYGKKLIYLSHYKDLCIIPFFANLGP
jgi:hypothetical protein